MIGGWISEDNFKPLMELLSELAHYSFDDFDWDAIRFGIQDTDKWGGVWYAYEFLGERPIKITMARNPNGAQVSFEIEADEAMEPEISLVIFVLQSYRLL